MAVDIAYARRGDISIAYTEVGDGPIDLIFGVGLMSHIDLMWADPHGSAWLRRLASGCRVILFDKPGTGLSDPVVGSPTLVERVEDFRAVLDAVGSRRSVVLGLSEAGAPAAMFAATYPERVDALVLMSTCARNTTAPDYLPEFEDHLERVIWAALWHGAAQWGDGETIKAISPLFRNSVVYSRLAGAVERASASPAMARAIIASVHEYDVRDVLPALRVPTLVIGRTHEWVPAEFVRDLARRIPGARLELFPGDEHLPWVDGDEIADAILRFIDAPPVDQRVADRALVSLLYTDIVSSTASLARAGDEHWRSVITQHEDMTAEVVARHGGRVVKTLGDGALALFDRPVQAVRCADAIRSRSAELGIDIRAAVHTGECEVHGEDVIGIAAHLASRALDHAGTGEIVVTGTVRDLTLGAGLHYETLGTFQLRDVPGRWELLTVTSLQLSGLRSVAEAAPERNVSSAQASMSVIDRSLVAAARRAPRVTRPLLATAGAWRRRSSPSAPDVELEPPP